MFSWQKLQRGLPWFLSRHSDSPHSHWPNVLKHLHVKQAGDSSPTSSGGFFSGAHDFNINKPTMIEHQFNISTLTNSLEILTEKRMVGVEVDSAHRHPPPTCHPETRKNVRDRANIWLKNPNRRSRLRYIWGPAGEGKSAIAQSIAEEAKNEGHLGASIFFSKLRDHDDMDRVIPTIVAQLATIIPEFASSVSFILEADPTILQKNCATQFKCLIIDPVQDIMERNPSIADQPLLIILDGIDECKDQRAQTDFIELVDKHVREVPRFPLLWLISSRQQAHLKPLLCRLHCEREDLKMDDPESQRDVELIIRDAFRQIREKYQAVFDTNWPSEGDLQRIIEVSSGFFAFGSSIIDFVSDAHVNNPEHQLKTCMEFLGRRSHISPLQALDLLYRQIMSEIPPESLPITKRVLGMSILYPRYTLPAKAQANFFGLARDEFIQSFRGLHAVLDMPSAQDAHDYSIKFLHTSFADFLKDPKRSRQFCIEPAKVHFDVALRALQWHTQRKCFVRKELNWVLHSENSAEIHRERQIMLRALRGYSSEIVLMACSNVPTAEATPLLDELEKFNFRVFGGVPDGIIRFIPWLHSLGSRGQALVHVASLQCPAEHSAKSISAQRVLDRQSKKSYSDAFGSNLFKGSPPYNVVFHLGKDRRRSRKKYSKKGREERGERDRDRDKEKSKERESGDDGNTCAFALALTKDPRSLLQNALLITARFKPKGTNQAYN